MAPHCEHCCHEDSLPASNLAHRGPDTPPVIGPAYSREELLSLRPLRDDDSANKTTSPVTIEQEKLQAVKLEQSQDVTGAELQEDDNSTQTTKPSIAVEEENIQEAKSETSQSLTGVEPKGDGTDGESQQVAGKKKKKKKSGGKNKNKGEKETGFEEYFCEGPITPQVAAEEKELYHQSRSFIERMQQCIQRYRARRKLDSHRSNIFSKYLVLGGVDAGVKAFSGGGLDKDTLENCNAAEIAEIQATDHIRSGNGPIKFYDAGNPVHWVIDFESVVKGFLSDRAPALFGLDPGDIKAYCDVIRNFLNYILFHNVCNEYNNEVVASLMLCNLAEKELNLITEVSALLPGDFNTAASTLYGGSYYGLHTDGGENFLDPKDPDSQNRKVMGMTVAEADRVFKTAIAFAGTYEHFQLVMAEQCYVINEEFRAMEVCEIIFPGPEMQKKLAAMKDELGHTESVKPLGVLKVKHWDNPEAPEEDMSDDGEEEAGNINYGTNSEIDSFWLEEHILEKCFIGMKLKATVRELSIGLKYMDSIVGVECSFYTYLATERLDGWREPIYSDRPGPTVDDPDRNVEETHFPELG